MDNLENNENMNENIDETNENINEETIDEAYEKEIEAEKLVEFDGESEGMELSKVEQEYGADEIQVLDLRARSEGQPRRRRDEPLALRHPCRLLYGHLRRDVHRRHDGRALRASRPRRGGYGPVELPDIV